MAYTADIKTSAETNGSMPEATSAWIGMELRSVASTELPTPSEAIRYNYEATKHLITAAGLSSTVIRGLDKFRVVFMLAIEQREELMAQLQTEHTGHRPFVRRILPVPKVAESGVTAGQTPLPSSIENADVIRITWHLVNNSNGSTSGEEYGCEIEFWTPSANTSEGQPVGRELVAPRANKVSPRVLIGQNTVLAPLSQFTHLSPRELDQYFVNTFPEMATPLINDVSFAIDLVYTWVDSKDPEWSKGKAEYSGNFDAHTEADSLARFLDRDELKYSLRSAYLNAPWINHIYIVTAGQKPAWLDLESSRVSVIDHQDIFANPDALPTFNSHAIESQLQNIPGLSEHFLYLNDDMFFGRPVTPEMFFWGNGVAKHFLSPSRVPFYEKSTFDTPVDQATKNCRRILKSEFGVEQAQVMEHAPYALRKSVMIEIARKYSESVEATSKSRFRDIDDLNIPSHLAHHYAFCLGKSLPSRIAFSYIGLSVPDFELRLQRLLLKRDKDAFCLNDTFTKEEDLEHQLNIVRDFLDSYFPYKPGWEK